MTIPQGYAAARRHPVRAAGLILFALMLSMTAFFVSRQDTHANLGSATFEIYDGNTHAGDGSLGATKDWANVYAGTSGAEFARFIPDVNFPAGTQPNGDDQPATGATKDPYDMDQWDCKAAGLAPPKNDIANAFVADYTINVATDNLHPNGKAQVIYFGLDRVNSDNGTADVGFWILKDSHACDLTSGKWNTKKHSLNDALIVSEFTGGGRVSTVNVFKWCSNPAAPDLKCGNSGSNTVPAAGKGDGPLQRVAGGADCRDATTGVPIDISAALVCATVNRGILDDGPEWPYNGAGTPCPAGSVNNPGGGCKKYERGAFFEGAFDATAIFQNELRCVAGARRCAPAS